MKVKKYEEGGALDAKFTELGGAMDIAQGAVKSIYGIKQLRDANQALSAAQASQPSLQTPAQFYENYRNAYDSELARMESDAIQGNVATSIQALQGAGGRALVGGLGAATAQAQNAQNKMLAQERQMRMQAGQQLALAEDKSLARREKRSQAQIKQAQEAAGAARQNIVGGVTDVATGLMAGGAKPIIAGAKKAAGAVGKAGKAIGSVPSKIDDYFTQRGIEKTRKAIGYGDVNQNMQNFINNQMLLQRDVAQSWQDYESKRVEQSILDAVRPQFKLATETVDRGAMAEYDFNETQRAKALPAQDQTALGGGGSSSIQGTGAIPSTKEQDFVLANMPPIQDPRMGYNAFSGTMEVLSPELQAAMKEEYPFGIKPVDEDEFRNGGMMTKGSFNHNTNPIDIVQNGQKIGEATGGEYILNPEQAAKIKKESSYARKLFKQFEKKAKSKK